MRIRMLKTRNFVMPGDRRVTTHYKVGCTYTVKRGWGEAMVADGDAEALEAPVRDDAPKAAPRRRRQAAP